MAGVKLAIQNRVLVAITDMTLGRSPSQNELFNGPAALCEAKLSAHSAFRYLHDHGHHLFADDFFSDLFSNIGRRSVPPRIVAVVMVLQKLEGLSDREAAERFEFDVRWKYAAGGLDVEYSGFVHTVLVDMRARLRGSENPNRIFDVVLQAARSLGVVGRKRVLDSSPIYDAVATQDTVTMVRSGIRSLLQAAPSKLRPLLQAELRRDDDYASAGKPQCDWDDEAARLTLVDTLTLDANAVLKKLEGKRQCTVVKEAAALLCAVVGQDIEKSDDGTFTIARRVAKDRIISTVDPDARHGHKTKARSFDGYKGHISEDPDSEIITSVVVTPGNSGDGSVAVELLAEVLDPDSNDTEPSSSTTDDDSSQKIELYGDAAYGSKEVLKTVDRPDVEGFLKVQGPIAPKGKFTKEHFDIDLQAETVTCPQKETVKIRFRDDGGGAVSFGHRCSDCPLRSRCTASKDGRSIYVNSEEKLLSEERRRQKSPEWIRKYKANRPKVERKIGHLMRRRHGARVARVRGLERVGQDFSLLAASINIARIAMLIVERPVLA